MESVRKVMQAQDDKGWEGMDIAPADRERRENYFKTMKAMGQIESYFLSGDGLMVEITLPESILREEDAEATR